MRLFVLGAALLGLAGFGCNAFGGAAAELAGSGGATASSSKSAGGGAVGGTSGTGASGPSGSTTSGGGKVEDCTNGIDDNGDGLVDCDDPQCQDFACVPDPPPGWSRPGAFYYDIPTAAPACPAADPTAAALGNGGLTFDDDSCGACSCDPRTGQSCAKVNVQSFTASTTCGGASTPKLANPNTCASPFFGEESMEAVTDYVAGSCTPTGGGISAVPTPTWTKAGKLCAPEAVGKCADAGSVCAAKVGGEFRSSVCISQSGAVNCPAGYPNKTTLYGDFMDGRGCSDCVCTPPPNDCTSTVTYYQGGNGDCGSSNPPGTLTAANTGVCETLTGVMSVKVHAINWPSQNASCTHSGGDPIGTVTGTSPITVCCH